MSRGEIGILDKFAERFSELVKHCGMQKKELAALLGIKYRNFRYYEVGTHKPEYEGLEKIADYFSVSVDYLMGRTDDPLTSEERMRRENEQAAGQS